MEDELVKPAPQLASSARLFEPPMVPEQLLPVLFPMMLFLTVTVLAVLL